MVSSNAKFSTVWVLMVGIFGINPTLARPVDCDFGAPHAAAPAEMEQFSFLIGDYDISAHAWVNGQWSPARPGPAPRWVGWYGLDGMAIYDEWYDPDPDLQADSPRGVNVRMFDEDAGEWDMMWLATGARQVQDLRAQVRDGVLTMWQVYPERPDFKATFHVTDEDHWHRIQYVKNEAGDWERKFKLAATRRPCPA